MEIFPAVKAAYLCADTEDKVDQTIAIYRQWQKAPTLPNDFPDPVDLPGRPKKPELVPPRDVPKRGVGSVRGRAALMHSVAHIEFNAINLALDMVLRFSRDPIFKNDQERTDFIGDWLSVAADEARHFKMISDYLETLGYNYGTFPAHNGLWDAALETSSDIAARLAVAPMVLEARGLDVTPYIIEKLRKNDEPEAIKILEVILAEEVQHVYFGTKWFNFVAQIRGKTPETYFQALVRAHYKGLLKKPFNKTARFEAKLYEDFYLPLS